RLAPTLFDVFPDLHADVIGVQPARCGAQDLGMSDEKFNFEALREIQSLEDAFVPKTSPTFVHDFGLDLGDKILGLFMNHSEQVFFPFRELRIVIANKKQDIFFRLNRGLGQIRGHPLLAPMDCLKWVNRWLRIPEFGFPLFYFCWLANGKIAPALEGQRMSRIQNAFYFLQSNARVFDVMTHPVRVRLERLDREFGPNRSERKVVFKKIVM